MFPDSSCLLSYGISSGAKLYLSIKKGQNEMMKGAAPCDVVDLWGKMRNLLRNHFTDSDTELVIGKFREVGFFC